MSQRPCWAHENDILRTSWSDPEHREVVKKTVSVQETRAIPSYIELAESERWIGDETEKPDSENSEYTVLSEPTWVQNDGRDARSTGSSAMLERKTCSLNVCAERPVVGTCCKSTDKLAMHGVLSGVSCSGRKHPTPRGRG